MLSLLGTVPPEVSFLIAVEAHCSPRWRCRRRTLFLLTHIVIGDEEAWSLPDPEIEAAILSFIGRLKMH